MNFRRLGMMVAALGLGARLASATLPPFDFTGNWTGTALETGKAPLEIAATLSSTSPTRFTGTLMVPGVTACSVHGKRTPAKVTMHLKCSEGSRIVLRGMLDLTHETFAGQYKRTKHGKHHPGTFELTKSP